MEVPKLKNIAILILVITNLCLLGLVLQRELQDQYFRWQTRENAIQLLVQGKGVKLDEQEVPEEIQLQPQTVTRDLEQEGVLAAQLLGDGVQTENRGAGVYRYFNDKGSLQFHSDGTFSGQFQPGVFPVGEDWEQGCRSVLEKMGFQGEWLETKGNALTFRQWWGEAPLFNQQVTLEISDGCVIAMTGGRRLIGEPVEDTSRHTVSPATALIEAYNGINALGYVCSRIDHITQGYISSTALNGPMMLTPVWRVSADTGEYQLNLVTGELTRVS